ncbi:hypothetical protein VHEMI08839 [[Torrubiella] hemipterigena]|uniref:Uncharacterized protein n=1 Tax=[Torrubiella] hemipterigena TaxID=1531966 RepID=A0A0A1TP99_9HYPO|nr:hypothetical protein VHEMI08839 [[Torrubiella] hemipterigena]
MEALSGIDVPQWPLDKKDLDDLYNNEPDVDEDNHQSRFSRQRLRRKFDKPHAIWSSIVSGWRSRRHARTRGPVAAEPNVTAAKRRSLSWDSASFRKFRQRIGRNANRAFCRRSKSNRGNTSATNGQRAPANTTGNSRGNGVQNESQRLPDGGGSWRQPQENNNPGGNNYNDRNNNEYNGRDENNKNDDDYDYNDADKSLKGVWWGCPYFKLDPVTYASCKRAHHKSAGSIMQHLSSRHVLKEGKSCALCRTQWQTVAKAEAQRATHNCQVPTGLREPMTNEEFKELKDYLRKPDGSRYTGKEYYDRLCTMAYRGTNEPPPKSGRLDAAWTERPTMVEYEARIKKYVDALAVRGYNAAQVPEIVRLVHESLHHELGLLPRRHELFSDSAPPLDLTGHSPAPLPSVDLNDTVAPPFSGVPVAPNELNQLTNRFYELPFNHGMPIELPQDFVSEMPGGGELNNGSNGYSMPRYVPSQSEFGNMMEGMDLERGAMEPPMGKQLTGSNGMIIDTDCLTMPMPTNEPPSGPSHAPSGQPVGAFQSMYSGLPPQTASTQQSASAYLNGLVVHGGQMFHNGNGHYAQNPQNPQNPPICWLSRAVASIVGNSSNVNELLQAWDLFNAQAHLGGFMRNHQCVPMHQACFNSICNWGSGGNMVNAAQAGVNQEGGIASSSAVVYEIGQDGSMSQNYAPQSNNN